MIKSKSDYFSYIKKDEEALGINRSISNRFKRLIAPNEIWEFQKLLRKCEYYKNCKFGYINKLIYFFLKLKLKKRSLILGYSIPENVFGPGLCLVHYGTIVVNPRAKVGANCRIHVCTNIGESGGNMGAPTIGDNVYIAPGVKIYGRIKVADNVAFAANAAISKDCLEPNSVYGGVPGKRIGSCDISRIIKHIKTEA